MLALSYISFYTVFFFNFAAYIFFLRDYSTENERLHCINS